MAIRLIREEDLEICGAIYSEAFSVRPYTGIWKAKDATDMLSGLLDRDPHSCWCVEQDGEIAGFIFCTQFGTFRATIQEFAIAPKYQKLRLGTALMQYALDEFRDRGMQTVDLVVNRDAPAYALYRKMGFLQPSQYAVMSRWL
jgi:ribosomal protein S18 acetylase RimI-like enzyme